MLLRACQGKCFDFYRHTFHVPLKFIVEFCIHYGCPSREAVGLNGQTLLSPKKWVENIQ
jgi:hypothetical protein